MACGILPEYGFGEILNIYKLKEKKL